jgi:starch-binding outer membrane protein, SusD/RagB family
MYQQYLVSKHLIKILLFVFLTCTGCKKILEVRPPEDLVTGQVVFSNDSMARAAVTGLYIRMMSNNGFLFNAGLTIYTSLSADEIICTSCSPEEQQFVNNNLRTDNGLIATNFWRHAYTIIYQANICLEYISIYKTTNTTLKNQLKGEAKFVRALSYYYLLQLFGEVPLLTTSGLDNNMNPPRTPVAKIYQQILQDLTDAWLYLNEDGPNTIPTKLAAAALLARVYSHLKDWPNAELFSGIVIGSQRYELTQEPEKTFLAASKETIFQLAPVEKNNSTTEGLQFIPASPNFPPLYRLSESLMAAFEPGDRRKDAWTNSMLVNGQNFHYPFKYKIKKTASIATEFNIVVRLAEQYLIRAEARIEQSKMADAIQDIDSIRVRAGLPVVSPTLSKTKLLSLVEKEARVEYFAEFGHRWISLKRTNRIHEVLSADKGNKWQPGDHLYPIPLVEIELNNSLEQNPGY